MFGDPPKAKPTDVLEMLEIADTRTDVESNAESANGVLEWHGLPKLKGVSREVSRRGSIRKTKRGEKDKYKPLLTTLSLPTVFEPQSEYTPEEKRERCLSFLNLYSQTGLRSLSAKAVGVGYGRIMLWVSEDANLRLELEIAEQSVQSQYEDIAHVVASSGDRAMIRFQLKRHEGRVVQKVGESMTVSGGGSMANVLNILEQASKNAKSVKE